MTSPTARRELHALARAMGIEVKWRGTDGEQRTCSDETLLATLQMLGIAVQRPDDARAARRQLERDRERLLDPVVVAWDGAPPVLLLRVPASAAGEPLEVVVEGDGGRSTWRSEECGVREVGVRRDVAHLEVRLPVGFATGRHRLTVEAGNRRAEAVLLASPTLIAGAGLRRAWGVFAPVYALHDRDRVNTGDLASLARLAAWTAGRGGQVVGTLPILATFLGHGAEPCDPSPYAPVTRRFWNEVYLDLRAVPEVDGDVSIVEPSPGQLVDLPKLAAARRPVLERAAARLDELPARHLELEHWLDATSDARDYARFRARVEGSGEAGERVHAFVQWQMSVQLASLAADASAREQLLYFDLPVGAHRTGFDVAAEGDLFVRDASVGAPPDMFFEGGQDWGFPPVHPGVTRERGHEYLGACLHAHFEYARALRIDHVMGLHRLWMIAPGADPSDGAYVHYAADEQWAVVCIEAARTAATVVGENLGTVPAETNRALRRHRALGMWVLEFELPRDEEHSEDATPPPANELACIDTHDLPTFATWWHDLAPTSRGALLEALRAAGELELADGELIAPETVLAATLAWLGGSRSPLVVASLEDLWLEPDPQNVPGADHQDARFRQRWAYGLDELDSLDLLKDALVRLDRARRTRRRRRADASEPRMAQRGSHTR